MSRVLVSPPEPVGPVIPVVEKRVAISIITGIGSVTVQVVFTIGLRPEMDGLGSDEWNMDGFVSDCAFDISFYCADDGYFYTFGINCWIEKLIDLYRETSFSGFSGFRVSAAIERMKKAPASD